MAKAPPLPDSPAASVCLVLIDDDIRVRTWIELSLPERGYHVCTAETGLAGVRAVIDQHPHVVLLDLGLPDVDGVEVLKMIRAVSAVPIIVITASDSERSTIRCLEAGADDYVIKPLSAEQLDARMRAVRRRLQREAQPTVSVGGLCITVSSRRATLDGKVLTLTPKEFDLLAYLAAHPGRVVTRRELLATVWARPWGGADKTVDVHVSLLRRKLGESASSPRYLRALRGIGVKLVDPSQADSS